MTSEYSKILSEKLTDQLDQNKVLIMQNINQSKAVRYERKILYKLYFTEVYWSLPLLIQETFFVRNTAKYNKNMSEKPDMSVGREYIFDHARTIVRLKLQ